MELEVERAPVLGDRPRIGWQRELRLHAIARPGLVGVEEEGRLVVTDVNALAEHFFGIRQFGASGRAALAVQAGRLGRMDRSDRNQGCRQRPGRHEGSP